MKKLVQDAVTEAISSIDFSEKEIQVVDVKCVNP